MRRRFRILLTVALLGVLGGPRSRALTAVYAERPMLASAPVMLDASDPARTRVGSLTLLAGWQMSSMSPQFGGWSGLAVDGDRFTVLGDAGSLLTFRLGRFGHATDARIVALPAGCGRGDDKKFRDSESLTRGPGGWWIGYESVHRICRVTPDFSRAARDRVNAQMARWPKSGGAEAMVRLSDGRFLVFAERARSGTRDRPLLVFRGDPTDPAAPVSELRYRPPEGYAPTDAAELPDGRIVVVNRRFGFEGPFTAILTIVDPATLTAEKTVEGVAIARFAAPVLHDNFEGVAVAREGARTILWLISDDNSMSWQRTYLLKFALDPDAGKPKLKPPAPLSSLSRSSASDAAP